MKIPGSIAIDGPAASGKSTLGRRLAEHLGYLYFDTGVMYRAVTWAALDRKIPISDEAAVSELANRIQIDVRPASVHDGRSCDVLVDGIDVTWGIREPDVDQNVSPVSAYAEVRRAMTAQQRVIGLRGNVVMVGRDIGTVVLPDAERKFYLDASVEERAQRRFREMAGRGGSTKYEDILAGLRRRDEIDSSRDIAPLKAADDSIILDSDQLGPDEVFLLVVGLIKNE